MSDALSPRAARRLLSHATGDLLRGRPVSRAGLEHLPPMRELAERADAGEAESQSVLDVLRRLDALPGRVQRALALERIDVVLADGSSMSLDEAERILAMKEDRRAHRALRSSIDDALAPFRQFDLRGIDDARRELMRGFLVDTKPLREAAREALAVLGGEPLEDEDAVARALDLPHENGLFGEEQTRALVTAARDAAMPPRPVGRVRAPRAMAGVALDAAAGPSFAWPSALRRFDRHARTIEACCTALAWAYGADGGRAAALALGTGPCRRAIGTDRGDAERAGRVGAAVAVLRARAAVALATVGSVSSSSDEARDAVAEALGVDPGRALLGALAAPPFVSVDDGEDAEKWMAAPSRGLVLREMFDETWPLRAESWHALAALDAEPPAPPASNDRDAHDRDAHDRDARDRAVRARGGAHGDPDRGEHRGDERGPPPAARSASAAAVAWTAWASELL